MAARFKYWAVMLFWILVAAMTAAVAALLLYPLLRGAKARRTLDTFIEKHPQYKES